MSAGLLNRPVCAPASQLPPASVMHPRRLNIAFIAPYQGPHLVKNRPCTRNLSLGTTLKIEQVAELLCSEGHRVEILSQGEVIDLSCRIYPALSESSSFHPDIPVHYASAFPVRRLNGMWSSLSTRRLFKQRHSVSRFDLLIIYNLKPPQVACAEYASRRLGLPVALEYEDDQFLEIADSDQSGLMSRYYLGRARRILGSLSGCVSGSPALLEQVPSRGPRLLLPGVVSQEVLNLAQRPKSERRNRVVFSGTHSLAQGLVPLITAWRTLRLPHWELHIGGRGVLTEKLQSMAAGDSSIVFHGLLDRQANAELLTSGRIAAVPYDTTQTRGFSFKTVECLAAGLHVISTPLVALDALTPEMKAGITYIPDNQPQTIASSLRSVITDRLYEHTSERAVAEEYGPGAVARSLEKFLQLLTSSAGS